MTNSDSVQDWFASAFTVRPAYSSGQLPGDLVTLWRCKVCAGLVEGPWRAAHRVWHLSSREVNQ